MPPIVSVTDCAKWLEGPSALDKTYVVGFIAGLSMAKGTNFWRAGDWDAARPADLFAEITRRCAAEPDKQLEEHLFWINAGRVDALR